MLVKAAALVVVGSAACAPAKSPDRFASWRTVVSEEGRFSVSMPSEPRARAAREGPVRAVIVASEDSDGAVYEVSTFDMPEPLTTEERALLVERVVVGLTGGPGAGGVKRAAVTVEGIPAVELRVGMGGGREGSWRIFYAGERRMFQVSAVGPAGARLAEGTTAFFASFELRPPP